MSDYIVEAELREETGRGATRRLRRAGKLPGIIYGGDKPDLPISMDYNTVSKLLNEEHFHTSMLEVKVKGSRGKNTVLLKDSQYDPLMDTATHLDFMRVSAKDSITMDVPVVAINFEKCPGVAKGGMVALIRHSLEVSCRADSIPEHIEIDCSELDMNDTVHIEDVALPKGVEIHHDTNFTVLNISAPKGAGGGESEEGEAAEAAEESAED
ncbi:LSU ribosomal protein L25P [Mariprofundus ferrinatatus]|uniref:Large ribosomal subunit protein bL25 n=1 Tax=Mariprofundus ferrinatatus TaxID=1921087 RepID=A0A2K8L695_9PROT|nr:50S ribosomal protein L25/general stress protein Ctc [Mariprofundus ferrinatatus]ATX81361.1 LSU ribosomal protein L25P [Mariprofundus ferrinatatus]